jgi:hypothetical protein
MVSRSVHQIIMHTSTPIALVDAAELQPQPIRRLIRDQCAEDHLCDGYRKRAVELALERDRLEWPGLDVGLIWRLHVDSVERDLDLKIVVDPVVRPVGFLPLPRAWCCGTAVRCASAVGPGSSAGSIAQLSGRESGRSGG